MISLEPRLRRIASFVPKCVSFADIGADHGLLSAFLLTSGVCERAQLVDISEASILKARLLMEKLNLADRARVIVGDGARALVEKPDCAVIAGMGGPTIAGIIDSGKSALGESLIITQPNVGMRELRLRLSLTGFAVEDEAVVNSSGRWYVIITARAGAARYDDTELLAGPILLRRGGEDFKSYVAFRMKIAQRALADDREGFDAPTVAMKKELDIWREVQKCL